MLMPCLATTPSLIKIHILAFSKPIHAAFRSSTRANPWPHAPGRRRALTIEPQSCSHYLRQDQRICKNFESTDGKAMKFPQRVIERSGELKSVDRVGLGRTELLVNRHTQEGPTASL